MEISPAHPHYSTHPATHPATSAKARQSHPVWKMADRQTQGLGRQVLQRLLTRIQGAVRHPLDFSYLRFICHQELMFIASISNHVSIPEDVISALTTLNAIVTQKAEEDSVPCTEVEVLKSGLGRPKFKINEDKLLKLVEMDLSVPCISKILGVSRQTVKRALQEYNISLKNTYSNVTDDQLDQLVTDIKQSNPDMGSRMMKGKLRALGHRITWTRIWESMRRVDGAGVLSRKAGSAYGCVARRVYSVPAPLSLVHLDTNHKLIRYGLVIFGAIDGFSRKIMYLGAATNNKASTALGFFLQSVENHGVPNRVRADQGCENVDIARWMFMVRGCGRGSFMSGKSVHNQRIERLWRDLWVAVTSTYYNVLHSLEEEGLLDPADSSHLFAAQYVFLPRLQEDLESFSATWDNHPLRTEENLTPNQLWEMGCIQNPIPSPDCSEGLLDLETECQQEELAAGIVLPSVACPLNSQGLEDLARVINPCGPSQNHGQDIYISVLNYVLHGNTV